MKTSLRALPLALLGLCLACSKTEPTGGGAAPSASAASSAPALTSAATSASAAAAGSASGAPSGAAAPSNTGVAAASYEGEADVTVADLTLPDNVKWKGDVEASDGVGKAKITLSVDEAGVVTGSGSGALGDVVVTGRAIAGVVSATLLRKSPSDMGYTGTLYATEEGGALKGTLHVSKGNAGGLREGKFTLSKGKK